MDPTTRARVVDRLRHRVRAGFEPQEDIVRSLEHLARSDEALRAELEVEVVRVFESLAVERAAWPRVTVNDRIIIAFIELTRARVVAIEDAGASVSDGWDVVQARLGEHPRARGAVFYHAQDLERGVRGEGLYLAFGSLPLEHPDERSRSLAIGREVVAALTKHRVTTEWDGTVKQRIRIPPFVWQRRLLPP